VAFSAGGDGGSELLEPRAVAFTKPPQESAIL